METRTFFLLMVLFLVLAACGSQPEATLVSTLAFPPTMTATAQQPPTAPATWTPEPTRTPRPTNTSVSAEESGCDMSLLDDYIYLLDNEYHPIVHRLSEAETWGNMAAELPELRRVKSLAMNLPTPCNEASWYRQLIIELIELDIKAQEANIDGDFDAASALLDFKLSRMPLLDEALDALGRRIEQAEGQD